MGSDSISRQEFENYKSEVQAAISKLGAKFDDLSVRIKQVEQSVERISRPFNPLKG